LNRREFITLLGSASAAWPFAVSAQQTERMRRIGVLMNLAADDPASQVRLAAFPQDLQQLGWTVGRNLQIDTRWAYPLRLDWRRRATGLVTTYQQAARVMTSGPRVRGLRLSLSIT
jgi:putative ABC transport system substrate-binding protein